MLSTATTAEVVADAQDLDAAIAFSDLFGFGDAGKGGELAVASARELRGQVETALAECAEAVQVVEVPEMVKCVKNPLVKVMTKGGFLITMNLRVTSPQKAKR